MKYLNKTNLSDLKDSIGLYNTLKNIRKSEFTFKSMEYSPVFEFIGRIQNFYLSFFQNQMV